MNKKLNVAAIQSELSGGSAYFPSYEKKKPTSPQPAAKTTVAPKAVTPPVRPVLPVPPVRVKQESRYVSAS
jgi:hypothetical protein